MRREDFIVGKSYDCIFPQIAYMDIIFLGHKDKDTMIFNVLSTDGNSRDECIFKYPDEYLKHFTERPINYLT